METARFDIDTTLLNSGDVLKFGMSDLPMPTKAEREAAALQQVSQIAYKTVQVVDLYGGTLTTMPKDALQLTTVVTFRQVNQNRKPELVLNGFWNGESTEYPLDMAA